MKTRHSISAAAVLAAILLPGCASSGPPADAKVVDVDRMMDAAESGDRAFVIRIPEGTRLPVHVKLQAPFAHAEDESPALHVVFDRTVFWYPPMPNWISHDGETWRELTDGHRGHLSFGLGNSEDRGVFAGVDIGLRSDAAE